MNRILARANRVRLSLAALLVAVACYPAGAQQPAENVLGVYRMQGNYFNLTLTITGQASVAPASNGQPRSTFSGFITEGSNQNPVSGHVVGTTNPGSISTPVGISFLRTLPGGVVQRYSGSVNEAPNGRLFMAGSFTHNGVGPSPWAAYEQ